MIRRRPMRRLSRVRSASCCRSSGRLASRRASRLSARRRRLSWIGEKGRGRPKKDYTLENLSEYVDEASTLADYILDNCYDLARVFFGNKPPEYEDYEDSADIIDEVVKTAANLQYTARKGAEMAKTIIEEGETVWEYELLQD